MKSTLVTVHEAKTNLSRLLQMVAAGEEVVIARASKPVARLVAIEQTSRERTPGSLKGKLHVGPEFFDPLPEEELSVWE